MGVGVLHKYGEFLPLNADTPLFSLGEGDTPLVQSRRIGPDLGVGGALFQVGGLQSYRVVQRPGDGGGDG